MALEIVSRADARAQGLKHFMTGLPCRHGHTEKRYVKDGKCLRCVAQRAAITGKRWAQRNPEKSRAKSKRWQERNPEKWKASNKASKQRNQARYSEEQRAAYREDPRPFREAWSRYYESRKDFHLTRSKIAGHKRRALKKGVGGTHTAADLKAILKAQGNRCAYCRADLRRTKRHVDHIMPIARGGSNGRANLQMACEACNRSKGAKHTLAFARERGLLL